ncbi:hypothetical protein DDB_G0285779 [Dictyostelium discoideum AX4]|uniref:Putative uncharacterized transmembrane protein DDB_G0285779 n=1 Tax=Dictyostelium discoideum TaxID=44689 RepID=Y8739_DICDI|nr:hypothetical protein DDB_G0285779 [Dictyostelium discoideum AX4]Q54MW0.1 RecName: Full=Putative uncharacterized transmembrane protein DDB_G0285779 [Dictyostelium discoideum]EAL64727.1 hypothetical protein DDB_G0285779 [Dictyostelium discoideum AX4]|eukprot:XP_638183.1 hypothetical protein DDB_G0285779 [Dictyostelium discoideum AX4]
MSFGLTGLTGTGLAGLAGLICIGLTISSGFSGSSILIHIHSLVQMHNLGTVYISYYK